MKEPYRHMEPKTEVKLSLYERVMSFAHEHGVKRQLLVACGAVLVTYAFVKLPYWVGEFLGKLLCGTDYWKPDLDGAGNPKWLDYSLISWLFGFFMMCVLWTGYLVSGYIFRKKD